MLFNPTLFILRRGAEILRSVEIAKRKNVRSTYCRSVGLREELLLVIVVVME